jgi:hypothetical protein
MDKKDIKTGEVFTIYNVSDPVEHPTTGKKFGYIYSFKGILEIEKAQEGYHKARISKSFRAIFTNDDKDDLLMPYHSVSSCVLPIPCKDTVTAHIVAAKDGLELLGQYSVVYIDAGHNAGVVEGNLLEVIEERTSVSDLKRKERVALPPTILGKILILEISKNTSTGVVFWVSKDFSAGVRVRALTSDERLTELAVLPECQIEQGK